MNRLNWRQGFFRLWIVASIFWVFGTSLIQFNNIYDDWRWNQVGRPIDFSDLIPKKDAAAGSPGPTKDDGPWAQFADAPKAPAPKLVPVEHDPFDRSFWGAAKPRLVSAIAIALLPPAVLFLVGWLLAWIAAGFRRA